MSPKEYTQKYVYNFRTTKDICMIYHIVTAKESLNRSVEDQIPRATGKEGVILKNLPSKNKICQANISLPVTLQSWALIELFINNLALTI